MSYYFVLLFCALIVNHTKSLAFNSQSQGKEKMVPETLWHLGRVSDAQLSPDGQLLLFNVTTYTIESNQGSRQLYVYSFATGETWPLPTGQAGIFNGVWRPDGKVIGYISTKSGSAQIWEIDPKGHSNNQISHIEGGITGFQYAPTKDRILYTQRVKLDETVQDKHPDLPLANARIIDDLMYRHWDTWSDYSYSHIFVAPYSNRIENGIDIMEGEPYHSPLPPFGGMNQIAFSPDGKYIAYTCKKIKGKEFTLSTNSNIYLYNIEQGTTEKLTKNMYGYDRYPVFSPNGKMLAWQSMKTPGFESDKARLMVYNFEDNTITYLTEGFDQRASDFIWSDDNKEIYFISGIHATYQLYKVDIETRNINQITEGVHNIHGIDKKNGRLIAEIMSMSMPTEIFEISYQTGVMQQITFTNKEVLENIELGKVEKRWIKTTDDKDMLVWVIYPPFFDAEKTYPALLYCQGGPQSAVSQFFSYRWNFQLMAAHDYIIVAPNRRGLPTFGQEWNDQISGDYGGQNMLDYLSAIDALAKEPFIDENRLGAVGASYGGFSVFWLAGNHNKRFNAFIAHCGMFNFESWYGSTEEMFFANHDLGGPYWEEEKPKSYDFSPHRFVGNWDTPILVIHGENDFRIPYTEGMQAFNAAQLQDIPSRFLYFPDETHFVLKPQNSILWQREFFSWLDKWLKK